MALQFKKYELVIVSCWAISEQFLTQQFQIQLPKYIFNSFNTSMVFFHAPWKHQKTIDFLLCSEGRARKNWPEWIKESLKLLQLITLQNWIYQGCDFGNFSKFLCWLFCITPAEKYSKPNQHPRRSTKLDVILGSELFHDGDRYHIETSPLICRAIKSTALNLGSRYFLHYSI